MPACTLLFEMEYIYLLRTALNLICLSVGEYVGTCVCADMNAESDNMEIF